MDYDDYRSNDYLRSATLVAATRCAVDDEPPTWEPVDDYDHLRVCEHREICKRAYNVGAVDIAREGIMATDLLCAQCPHFEDSGVSPV